MTIINILQIVLALLVFIILGLIAAYFLVIYISFTECLENLSINSWNSMKLKIT